jgi:hypothetical protein
MKSYSGMAAFTLSFASFLMIGVHESLTAKVKAQENCPGMNKYSFNLGFLLEISEAASLY